MRFAGEINRRVVNLNDLMADRQSESGADALDCQHQTER